MNRSREHVLRTRGLAFFGTVYSFLLALCFLLGDFSRSLFLGFFLCSFAFLVGCLCLFFSGVFLGFSLIIKLLSLRLLFVRSLLELGLSFLFFYRSIFFSLKPCLCSSGNAGCGQ